MAAKDLLGEIRLEAAFLKMLCCELTDVNDRAREGSFDPDLLAALMVRLEDQITGVAAQLSKLIAEAEDVGLMDLFAEQARQVSAEVV